VVCVFSWREARAPSASNSEQRERAAAMTEKGSYIPVELTEKTDENSAESPVAVAVETAEEELVEVVAPANLPEGYEFEVTASDETFTVRVPQGGVKEGELFRGTKISSSSSSTSNRKKSQDAPVGGWKNGLCDCCIHGCCHAHFWLGLCFPQCLLAQVMVRLDLDMLGQPRPPTGTPNSAFTTMVVLTVVWLISHGIPVLGAILSYPFFIYLLLATCWVRQSVRQRYAIPEQDCKGCEDFCCAFCCGKCAICQMARHTANYETEPSQCCTNDGLNHV